MISPLRIVSLFTLYYAVQITHDVGEVRDDRQVRTETALQQYCRHDDEKQQLQSCQQLISDTQCERHHRHTAQQKLQTKDT